MRRAVRQIQTCNSYFCSPTDDASAPRLFFGSRFVSISKQFTFLALALAFTLASKETLPTFASKESLALSLAFASKDTFSTLASEEALALAFAFPS